MEPNVLGFIEGKEPTVIYRLNNPMTAKDLYYLAQLTVPNTFTIAGIFKFGEVNYYCVFDSLHSFNLYKEESPNMEVIDVVSRSVL